MTGYIYRTFAALTLAFTALLCSVPAHAVPITDFVTRDGNDWAQVADFTNLSWNDINAVCPAGVCGAGQLNGFDMAGWAWAGLDAVNALFNSYLGAAGVSATDFLVGPDRHDEINSTWAPDFSVDFTATSSVSTQDAVGGLLSDDLAPATQHGRAREALFIDRFSDTFGDEFRTDTLQLHDVGSLSFGAWFTRTAAPVPNPSTLFLLGLSLLGLRVSRKRAIKQDN